MADVQKLRPTVSFIGDAGAGGKPGAVPAPGAGDAAAGKFLKADASWAAPVAAPTCQEAAATADATTTSNTPVVLTGMSITPGVGTWLALFSGTFKGPSSGSVINVYIYEAGVQVAASARHMQDVQPHVMSTMAKVVVSAGQVVDVRWDVSAGTGTCNERTLELIRVT